MLDWPSSLKRAFVPTMGALHNGHLALLREARQECEEVVVSILVNPLQFGTDEDFASYPRTLERDLELCHEAGVDIVFCPLASDIYHPAFDTRICGGWLAKQYCGVSRPIFFEGVLTVVNILFNLVRPNRAYFGEKDFQQLFLIQKMVRDLWIPVHIVGVPVVRESNGLALSSRNAYLTREQRQEASCLYQAICTVRESVLEGEKSIDTLRKIALKQISLELDYLEFVSEISLKPIEGFVSENVRLLIAAYIGNKPRVRLIDNGIVSDSNACQLGNRSL
ncbi:MAG: pantoate--beta-alanine ligase [Myxococcaceae bacterium]|nr:pantoate--beta-alanine ligase [Myxococcaceae bacterium]